MLLADLVLDALELEHKGWLRRKVTGRHRHLHLATTKGLRIRRPFLSLTSGVVLNRLERSPHRVRCLRDAHEVRID